MALDSAAKRASVAQMTPTGPVTRRPTSVTIDQASRQAMGWGYYGLLVGSPVVAAVEVIAITVQMAQQVAQSLQCAQQVATSVECAQQIAVTLKR